MKKKREIKMTGISQITINWKWVIILSVIFIVYMSGVSWLFLLAATGRPATVHTGGY